MAASRIETPFTAMGSNNQEPAKAKGKAVLDVASIHVVDANLLQKAYPAQQSAESKPRSSRHHAPTQLPTYRSADEFSQKVELYRGSVSTVYKALHDATNMRVILKCYHKKKMQDKHYHKLDREIRAMAAVRGPYVADMYGWFADEEAIWLVLELCEGGDLFKTMMLHGGRLDEHYVCVEIVAPLLRVLEKCHALGLMHRDIKPENIFLTRLSKFRLGDWGLAINWHEEIPFSRSGTLDYMAPEVLRNPASQMQEGPAVELAMLAAKNIRPYDAKVDVWAVGVLAYELVVGKPPFEVEDEAQTASLIMYSNNIRYPSAHSASWADFVRTVLVKDPATRPSAGELMAHPWIQSNLHKAISAAAAQGRVSSKELLLKPLALPAPQGQQGLSQQQHHHAHQSQQAASSTPTRVYIPAAAQQHHHHVQQQQAPATPPPAHVGHHGGAAAMPRTPPPTAPAHVQRPHSALIDNGSATPTAHHHHNQHHSAGAFGLARDHAAAALHSHALDAAQATPPTGPSAPAPNALDRSRSCLPSYSSSRTASFQSAASNSFEAAAAAIAAAAEDAYAAAGQAQRQAQAQQQQQGGQWPPRQNSGLSRASPLSKSSRSAGGAPEALHAAAAGVAPPGTPPPAHHPHHHHHSGAAQSLEQAFAAAAAAGAHGTVHMSRVVPAGVVAAKQQGLSMAPLQANLPQLQQGISMLKLPLDSPEPGAMAPNHGPVPPTPGYAAEMPLASPMPGPGMKQRSIFHLQRQAMA